MNKAIEFWKKLNKRDFFIRHFVPNFVIGCLCLIWGILIGAGPGNGPSPSSKELSIPISNTVDLPSQITELQSSELLVFEKQLSNIKTDNNRIHISQAIASLNYQNKINDFLGAVVSLRDKDDVETQYNNLTKYTAADDYSTEGEKSSVSENLYKLIGGNSWAKETKSQVSKAGTSVISLLTGSDNESAYYMAIVPVTNQKRDFANVVYFIRCDKQGDIVNCVYGGTIKGLENNQFYKDLSSLYPEK